MIKRKVYCVIHPLYTYEYLSFVNGDDFYEQLVITKNDSTSLLLVPGPHLLGTKFPCNP